MSKQSVQLDGTSLVLSGIRLVQRDVVDYFTRMPEEEREAAVGQAIEVGVFCLERASTGRSMEFVKLEVQSLLSSVSGSLSGLPKTVQEELLSKLGTEDGQALAPIKGLVNTVQQVVNEKLKDITELLNEEIDPRNESTTLGRALGGLRTLLDPEHDTSIQKKIEGAVRSISSSEGLLATTAKRVVEDATKPLRDAVDRLTQQIHGEAMVTEALAETTEKGEPFERDEVQPKLRDWAAVVGAEVEHVGPDNEPGDFVITVKSTSLSAMELRIVVEAKAREDGWGKTRIADAMSNALEKREGDYGIFVTKTLGGLSKRDIGEWEEGQCSRGPYIACVFEHLRTALRFILVERRLQQLRKSKEAVDQEDLKARVDGIRTCLDRIRTINTNASTIRSSVETIEEEASSLRKEVNISLDDIESLLRRTSSPTSASAGSGAA